MGFFSNIVDFFYEDVPDTTPKQSRNYKRFTSPKFEIEFDNGDSGTSIDWSQGGMQLTGVNHNYSTGARLQGKAFANNKLVGLFSVKVVMPNQGSKLKVSMVGMDRDMTDYINRVMREQRF